MSIMASGVNAKNPAIKIGGFGWSDSAPDNAAVQFQSVKQYGNVVSIKIYFSCTSAINKNGNIMGRVHGVDMPQAGIRALGATGTALWEADNPVYTALDYETGDILLKTINTTDRFGLINIEYIV